jgi:putative oxidoreductase
MILNHLVSYYLQQLANTPTVASWGLLGLRIALGVGMAMHGWPKLQNAFGWFGTAIPAPLQAVAAVSEVAGGILLATGLLTPLAALMIVGAMMGAMVLVHLPAGHPFIHPTGGESSELAVVYGLTGLLYLFNGPGRLSLDALIALRVREEDTTVSMAS